MKKLIIIIGLFLLTACTTVKMSPKQAIDKMSEEELTRRSADFRKGSRKNKYTHEANDKFKKEHKHHEDENDDEKKEEDE